MTNDNPEDMVGFLIGFLLWVICGGISFTYILIKKDYQPEDSLFEVFFGCFLHGPIGILFMLSLIFEDFGKKKKKISDEEFERIKREHWEDRLKKGI